jgi:hypothetical protein
LPAFKAFMVLVMRINIYRFFERKSLIIMLMENVYEIHNLIIDSEYKFNKPMILIFYFFLIIILLLFFSILFLFQTKKKKRINDYIFIITY